MNPSITGSSSQLPMNLPMNSLPLNSVVSVSEPSLTQWFRFPSVDINILFFSLSGFIILFVFWFVIRSIKQLNISIWFKSIILGILFIPIIFSPFIFVFLRPNLHFFAVPYFILMGPIFFLLGNLIDPGILARGDMFPFPTILGWGLVFPIFMLVGILTGLIVFRKKKVEPI